MLGGVTSMGGEEAAPLVGRAPELHIVEAAVQRLGDRTGGAIAFVGQAGVGKSRLARETAVVAAAAGAHVVTGRAVTTGGTTAYRPFIEALAPWARAAPRGDIDLGTHNRALEALVPGWSGGGNDTLSPMFVAEAVIRLLPHLAADDRPVVLVLEDLHWADEETLAAVEYLVDAAETLPLLLVLTARDEQAIRTRRLLRALAARGAVRLVQLGPLDAAATRDLAELRLAAPVTAPLLDLLVRRAEGLPLFVEELLAALDAAGALLHGVDGVDIAANAARVLPDTVADTVATRLDSVPDEKRRVLESAALLGPSFDHDLLLAVHEPATVEAALLCAITLGLLQEDPDRPAQLRFRHALLRDGVLAATYPPRRAELARALLDVLLVRDLSEDERAVAIDLAARAGDNPRAARLAIDRAMEAFDVWAMASADAGLTEARQYAGTDANLLIEIDVTQMRVASIMGRLDLVQQLGNALLLRLDPPGGRHDAELLETHLRLGQMLLDEERWQDAQPHMDAAAMLIAAGDECHVTRLELWSSLLERLRGDREAARTRAVRAADLARPHAYQSDLVCCALMYEGRAWIPDVDTARARWQEALDYADRYGLRLWRARMLLELALLELDELAGDVAVDDVLVEADQLATECGGVLTRAGIALLQARLAFLRLDVDQAWARLRAATEFGIAGASARRAYSDLEAALTTLTTGTVGADATLDMRIFAALVVDDLDTARALGRNSSTIEGGWGGRPLALFIDLVDLDAVGVGGVIEARASLPDLVAASQRLSRAPLLEAFFTRVHATGATEDREALHAAVGTFDRLGLTRPADACRAMLREAGVPVPRRSTAQEGVPNELRAAGITTRELDVLRLIAEGHSNKEVAAALYLSPRTVEKHVERLLLKTGMANRTALAALGLRSPSALST